MNGQPRNTGLRRSAVGVAALLLFVGRTALADADDPAPAADLPAPAPRLVEDDLPAYRLAPAVELPLLAVGALLMVPWLLDLEPARCAPSCDPADLNALDRPVAGFYDERWRLASDLGLVALGAGAVVTLIADEGLANGLGDLVVVLEAFVAATGLSVITATATRRPRPLVYGERAPLAERRRFHSSLSFFSGHTAGSFALATALVATIWRRKPGSPLAWVALALSGAAAALVGTGRVMAGKHFPSDVLVGAGIGTALGIAIPALHARPALPVELSVSGTGVALTYRW